MSTPSISSISPRSIIIPKSTDLFPVLQPTISVADSFVATRPKVTAPAINTTQTPSDEATIDELLKRLAAAPTEDRAKGADPSLAEEKLLPAEETAAIPPTTDPASGQDYMKELLDKYGFGPDDDARSTETSLPVAMATPLPVAIATPYEPEPDYKPISFDTLFPTDLRSICIKQQDIADCYLLAPVDALFHHPDGADLLRKVKFETAENTDKKITHYKVTFPSGLSAEINADEVGKPKSGKRPVDAPLGVQLLELAFAKATRVIRNAERISPFGAFGIGNTVHVLEYGFPYEALNYMFGGEQVGIKAIPATPLPSGLTIEPTDPLSKNPNGLKMLKDTLRNIEADISHTTIISGNTPEKLADQDGIKIIMDNGSEKTLLRKHSYAIRNFDLARETITIADPHDTKTKVMTLSFKEFIQAFHLLQGVKLPKATAAA